MGNLKIVKIQLIKESSTIKMTTTTKNNNATKRK